MNSELKTILSEVLRRTTPSSEERNRVFKLAEKLKSRLGKAAEREGVEIEVRVEGSVAKDTWLRKSPDIDIFMLVPPTVPRETFETLYLKIAKAATKDAKQVERFAEHPYLEATIDGILLNLVPCYHVKKGEWMSATDRTPFHTDYVKALLNDNLRGEIRLLKQFMKRIGVYGAEIKVGGFSGYLCELLILYYSSFKRVLEAACNWNAGQSIDIEAYYKDEVRQLKNIFQEPLVIVDPVDRERNAASAVRLQALNVFMAASRRFLTAPSESFFYPLETKPFSSHEIMESFQKRRTSFIFVRFEKVNVVPDVLWGQLYKSQKSLRKFVSRHGFNIVHDAVWSDEKNFNFFIFELEHKDLPSLKKHLGPPLVKKEYSKSFLKKHAESDRTLSGPQIECGRWIVDITREYTAVEDLLEANLRDGGRGVGIAEHISHAMEKTLKILIDEEVLQSYTRNRDFAMFLTDYLKGRPKWLT